MMIDIPCSARRQFFLFVFFGAAQLLFDTGLFAFLIFLDCEAAISNVLSRLSAAAAGYYLNGKITFTGGSGLGVRTALFYISLWVILTLISTTLVHISEGSEFVQLDKHALIVSKFFIESIMAFFSFIAMKYFIFSKR